MRVAALHPDVSQGSNTRPDDHEAHHASPRLWGQSRVVASESPMDT
eukprot:CAMPEP_0182539906 /NCGR_PEP_ID=MMETSP1323-20130603/26185_1 /TAXON_ID=236787 /ORGANISM="Florenciella parvula, Strain RCC1693" /LENGTH=45 /DNA_ID= /DNA_START= /DNA_END= /DNA_ORIENTATION=